MITRALDSFKWESKDPEYKNKALNIIDIGTGCGLIAILLKKELPNSRLYACDVSEKALKVARKNAESRASKVEADSIAFVIRKAVFRLMKINSRFQKSVN